MITQPIIKFMRSPMISEFAPLQGGLIERIIETGNVFIKVSSETKKSYSISIYNGTIRKKINIQASPNLKYHSRREINMWSNESYIAYYLKAKEFLDFVDHICCVLDEYIKSDIQLILTFELTEALRSFNPLMYKSYDFVPDVLPQDNYNYDSDGQSWPGV